MFRSGFRGCFVVCSPPIHRVFAALLQFVRHIIIICVMRNEKPFATSSPPVRHPFCVYAMHRAKLGVTCLFCGCYVFGKQKGVFCNIKTPFLHDKNHTFKTQQYSYGVAPTILAKCNAHILAHQTRYFCFAKTIFYVCNALFMGYLETA